MTDYVYPGYVRSRNDGDRHWVSGASLIRLYGLDPRSAVIVDLTAHGMLGRRADEPGDRHFHPRYDGAYFKAPPAHRHIRANVRGD